MLWNRFSPVAVILIVRIPNRPSRPKTISIPSVRRNVCARRSRPASAVWLLQFTRIWLDAPVLEFDLSDISAEVLWGVEGVKDAKRWPRLPLATMVAGDPV